LLAGLFLTTKEDDMNEKGYTIVELLQVLTGTAVLAAIVYVVVHFIVKFW
jgi:Tfp pilus assembly protein PilE